MPDMAYVQKYYVTELRSMILMFAYANARRKAPGVIEQRGTARISYDFAKRLEFIRSSEDRDDPQRCKRAFSRHLLFEVRRNDLVHIFNIRNYGKSKASLLTSCTVFLTDVHTGEIV